MTIEIAHFSVEAKQHPASDKDSISWLIFVRVKFQTEDPSQWGELRAYGGGWIRTISWLRTIKPKQIETDDRKEYKSQVVAPGDVDIEDLDVTLNAVRNLPPWPGYRPTFDGSLSQKDLRLGNDQHIEIFYAKEVPFVPRSCSTTKDLIKDPRYLEYDPMVDPMGYDNVKKAERPAEIDTSFHIFGRDEPERTNFMKPGDYCEYYHAAEFHIRPPRMTNVIAKKTLLLIAKGYYGELQYFPAQIE